MRYIWTVAPDQERVQLVTENGDEDAELLGRRSTSSLRSLILLISISRSATRRIRR
ncbi:MAG: hypothetical protein V9F06_14655 [Thermomicrobiales bacterium]